MGSKIYLLFIFKCQSTLTKKVARNKRQVGRKTKNKITDFSLLVTCGLPLLRYLKSCQPCGELTLPDFELKNRPEGGFAQSLSALLVIIYSCAKGRIPKIAELVNALLPQIPARYNKTT